MRLFVIGTLCFAVLTGCSKSAEKSATAPAGVEQTATVKLKDGGSFTGAVKSSDSTAITLVGPGGESRTYPIGQVAAVDYLTPNDSRAAYNPSPLAAPAPVANPPAPVNTPSPSAVRENPAPIRPNPPAQRMAERVTVPAGVTIEVRNNESIDSTTAQPNQIFSAVVTRDIEDEQGRVAVPRGSNASLIVREVNDQGKVQGRSELVLDIASLQVAGRTYRVETRDLVERGKEGVGANKRTAEYTGGIAALGSIIGAIAGGGKGAAIGAASGAAAGGGIQTATRGKAVRVPSETILRFTLEQPVQIRLIQ